MAAVEERTSKKSDYSLGRSASISEGDTDEETISVKQYSCRNDDASALSKLLRESASLLEAPVQIVAPPAVEEMKQPVPVLSAAQRKRNRDKVYMRELRIRKKYD